MSYTIVATSLIHFGGGGGGNMPHICKEMVVVHAEIILDNTFVLSHICH